MRLIENRDGFSIVEVLLVIGVIGILVAMGGALAAKFSIRKSVDRITGDISSPDINTGTEISAGFESFLAGGASNIY